VYVFDISAPASHSFYVAVFFADRYYQVSLECCSAVIGH